MAEEAAAGWAWESLPAQPDSALGEAQQGLPPSISFVPRRTPNATSHPPNPKTTKGHLDPFHPGASASFKQGNSWIQAAPPSPKAPPLQLPAAVRGQVTAHAPGPLPGRQEPGLEFQAPGLGLMAA